MLSVAITACNEPYLQRTIDSVFEKARGELEVIAVLDGYRPEIKEHKDLTLIYHPEPHGQRHSINEASKLARGKYFMKLDAHCIMDEGYDLKLKEVCQPDWTIIPRRHGVIEDRWKRRPGRVDYMRLTCPDEPGDLGLRAKAWPEYRRRGRDPIDDVMTCQGSGWFQYLERFRELGCLDEGHGHWGAMGCEVGNKTWLSGGRLIVCKSTWYAHWQRGRKHTRNDIKTTSRFYYLPRQVVKDAHKYAKDLWFNNKWSGQKLPFVWLLEKFWPVPGWSEEWLSRLKSVA